jgi:AcrR family transcriptional regulator
MRSGRARPPLTIAEVATRAELARSVVYNYFADVRSLLVAHAEHETRRFLAELQGALGSAGTATERVTIYVRRQLADFAANPQPAGPELAPLLGRHPDRLATTTDRVTTFILRSLGARTS